jgi:hypothetical protein
MNTSVRLIGIVVLLCLTCFTSNKLIKMAQIRGFIRGPVPVAKVITSKAVLTGDYGNAYWIAWDNADIHAPSRARTNLSPGTWQALSIGDHIEVLYFSGDQWPYLRQDIFADNGNFAFDGLLLTVWLAGIVVLVAPVVRRFRRDRDHLPPPLPGTDFK